MITLNVNGRKYQLDIEADMPLLWALRNEIGLTGTKYGCGIGECGACTVLLQGQPVRSCRLTVENASGGAILTIEGLSAEGSNRVQAAWVAEDVPQCGYCQSGQILAAVALLDREPNPTDEHINAITNICRCGTYTRIRRAIHRAAGVKL